MKTSAVCKHECQNRTVFIQVADLRNYSEKPPARAGNSPDFKLPV